MYILKLTRSLLVLLVFFIPISIQANWSKNCGNNGQVTCIGPIHHGCKKNLIKCDIPFKRDICKTKGHCPKSTRTKHKCKDCGRTNQKPCLFKNECHLCEKGHHISLKGKCVKTSHNVLLQTLEEVDSLLKEAEKTCKKGFNFVEGKFYKATHKKNHKTISQKTHSYKLVNEFFNYEHLVGTCYRNEYNGIECGVIPWVRSYNKIAMDIVNIHNKDGDKRTRENLNKDSINYAKKYLSNFLHGDVCKYIIELETRAICAGIETLIDEAKKPSECIVNTTTKLWKDYELDKKKHHKKHHSTLKEKEKVVGEACYSLGSTVFTVAADQLVGIALEAPSGGESEVVEAPKDSKKVYEFIKVLFKAKLKLEKGIDSAEVVRDILSEPKIKSVMKKYKSCDGILKYLK